MNLKELQEKLKGTNISFQIYVSALSLECWICFDSEAGRECIMTADLKRGLKIVDDEKDRSQ